MKALIMEVNNGDAVVLTRDGQFLNIKLESDQISYGEEIEIESKTKSVSKVIELSSFRRFALIAAVFLLILLPITGSWAYYTPTGYIEIDINPSLEIVYNRFNRVIGVNGLNEDGKEVIESMPTLKGSVEDVTELLVNQAKDLEYLVSGQENIIMITVVSIDKDDSLNPIDYLTLEGINKDEYMLEVVYNQVDLEQLEEAKDEGLSINQKILSDEIRDIGGEDYAPQDNEHKSIKELKEKN
eukprot:TRINITY_DN14132_c0_g1_i1.p1 TRINITY_DN14132_c0_g1~~TRINITY_DN14132_c0_g1_i1.p1  ORF type:complete len:241 (+),score=38.29 TRINITY_DN14132_c0_g1_i1:170-892(+)